MAVLESVLFGAVLEPFCFFFVFFVFLKLCFLLH